MGRTVDKIVEVVRLVAIDVGVGAVMVDVFWACFVIVLVLITLT